MTLVPGFAVKQLRLTHIAAMLAALATAACGEEGTTDPPGGGSGATIQVFTNTLGINVDADGYRVRVSGDGVNRTENLGPVDNVTFSNLPEGDYTVSLEAVAANCAADESEVSFSLTESNPRLIPFSVICS